MSQSVVAVKSSSLSHLGFVCDFFVVSGWSGGAKVLGNFQCRGVLLIWNTVGQGPTVLAVGAGMGCVDIFSFVYHFSLLSLFFLPLSGRRPDID